MTIKIINYQLISASGNPTAIISGNYPQNDRQIINKSIFLSNKLVEQVGYIYQNKNQYYFNMMGQEFSGNGCRAAAFCFLRQQPGIIQFQSNGANSLIAVSLDKFNNTLPTDTPGVGIMFINRISVKKYYLDPYFFTRETNTLINETACGSGSTAVTIYLSQKYKKDYLKLNIIQPSNLSIYTRCYYSSKLVNTINISGPTKMLGNYNVKIKL